MRFYHYICSGKCRYQIRGPLAILCILFWTEVSSQQLPAEALEKLYNDYPQEKIYLWYNKPAYVAGETVFFKAYTFWGYDLSLISSTLYVELYDANKKLIGNKLFPLLSGVTEGSIDLNNKIEEGVYYIRAYTQWMLNFDESLQYIHQLLVYNPASSKHLAIDNSRWKAGVFPEGGSLIENVETKVAVRRFANGLPKAEWRGYLYDESNPSAKIKEFTSLDENVALFKFIPGPGKKYSVAVSDEFGNNKVCPLPPVKNTGVSISIDNQADTVAYQLKFQNIPGRGNGYSIVGQMQHQMVYQANFRGSTGTVSAKIPTDQMNTGILHLTVFDPLNNPVTERLVFVNGHKPVYDTNAVARYHLPTGTRAASEIELKVDSINWISYAVSVTEEMTTPPVDDENILSALWLASDISAPLQNSAAYFKNPGKVKIEALDAAMISEKWQRFRWADILTNKYPTITHRPLQFLSYTGKIKKGNKLRPNEEVTLVLFYPDSTKNVMLSKTDSVGNIVVDNLVFYDELKIFYQLNNKKSNAKMIDIDFERNNQFVPYTLGFPETSYILSSADPKERTPAWVSQTIDDVKTQKEFDDKAKTLQEVIVMSKSKSPKELLNEQLSSSRFNTTEGTVFDFVNENQTAFIYSNVLQWLVGRVPSFDVMRDGTGTLVPVIRGSIAAVFVDEIRVDPSYLDALIITDIAMIKVIRGGAYALQAGVVGGGVVAIYTYRKGVKITRTEPSLPFNKIRGYDTVKKINLPDYEDKSSPQPGVDKRNQLLWQTWITPQTSPDRSGIKFYNNDQATQYRVIVQGFTHNGMPVYYNKVMGAGQR